MNNLIYGKLKEIMQLPGNINLDNLEYKTKEEHVIILVDTLYLLFLRDIHKGHFS